MRPFRIAILALPASILGACASTNPVTEAKRISLDRSECVASVSQLAAIPLPRLVDPKRDKFKPLQFENLAKCALAADANPVPVALFQTDGIVPTEVKIALLVDASIAFAAAVDLLDEHFALVRTVPFQSFVRRGNRYTGSVFLNAQERGIRYLLLRPDSDDVGKSESSTFGVSNTMAYAIPVPGGVIYGSYSSGSEQVLRTWLSEVGSFSIIATDYRPAQTGADGRVQSP